MKKISDCAPKTGEKKEGENTGRFRKMMGMLEHIAKNSIFSAKITLRRAIVAGAVAVPLIFGAAACDDSRRNTDAGMDAASDSDRDTVSDSSVDSGTPCMVHGQCADDEACERIPDTHDYHCVPLVCDEGEMGTASNNRDEECEPECYNIRTIITCECDGLHVVASTTPCPERQECDNEGAGEDWPGCVDGVEDLCTIYPEGDNHRHVFTGPDFIMGLEETGIDLALNELLETGAVHLDLYSGSVTPVQVILGEPGSVWENAVLQEEPRVVIQNCDTSHTACRTGGTAMIEEGDPGCWVNIAASRRWQH
ncbi:hypothetical protein KKF81_07085 [Candidatus Micrarchaeota archaeon]|nr:hypothetical protein [Candidatus Micrarchaeota archaeon]MBU1166695.1 hypothetical protein [Candidatus Micrarchaeota archaeon]MBU1886120.1 hypothetical protein [Candidatus Micrarchaeota archaeon]